MAANLQQEQWTPEMYGGVTALRTPVKTVQTAMPEHLATHLLYFALPLGLRHKADAATFLREGNRSEAADLVVAQAQLLGQAQYAVVQHDWTTMADQLDQVAILEEQLLAVCAS